jgi:hypothetical protein
MGRGLRIRRTVFGESVSLPKLSPGVRGTTRKLALRTIKIWGHGPFLVTVLSCPMVIVVTAGQPMIGNPIVRGCRRAEPAKNLFQKGGDIRC